MVFFLSACAPDITIQATASDGATVSFKTGFSKSAEQTIQAIIGTVSGGSDASASLFNADDITVMMQRAGLQNVTTVAPDATQIATKGTAQSLSVGALAQTHILTRTQKSLTLALGATQFQALYALLDEETQAYFDLMMIPALSDETMTPAAYNALLASVYGQTFADEITQGVFTITLRSPDGKKQTTAKATVGELLTLTAEKKWTVAW